MCDVCRHNPCCPGCPNYSPTPTNTYCSVCREMICVGEAYIENGFGEYMHYDCIPSFGQLLEWLECEVKIMEGNR